MARGVDKLYRVTQALFRVPVVSTRCPGHSGPGPMARGVDKLYRATQALSECPWC